MNTLSLLQRAESVLARNFNGTYTQSFPDQPHLSGRNAAFIIIGLAHVNYEQAVANLRYVFDRQQANGMLPYFVETEASASADLTHPPLWGHVLEHLYRSAPDDTRGRALLYEFFPKIHAFHTYLYEQRDPEEEGLICLHHLQESGLYAAAALGATVNDVPYRVQDPLFNSLLCKSNASMQRTGDEIGTDVTDFTLWNELTIYSINDKLRNADNGLYEAYDLNAGRLIPCKTRAGLLPLFGNLPTTEQAQNMLNEHRNYVCYNPKIQENQPHTPQNTVCLAESLLLYRGLLSYGLHAAARRVKADTLALLTRNGFCADYAADGSHGTPDSAVAAAVVLDMFGQTQDAPPSPFRRKGKLF